MTTHFDRWVPARVLAECEAKRRIVEHVTHRMLGEPPFASGRVLQGLQPWRYTLQLLALPYSDHPDYDPAWK